MATNDYSIFLTKLKKVNIKSDGFIKLLQEIDKKFESSIIPYDISEYLCTIYYSNNISGSQLISTHLSLVKLLTDNYVESPKEQKATKLAKLKELIIAMEKDKKPITMPLLTRLYAIEDTELTTFLQQHYKMPKSQDFQSDKVPQAVLDKEAPARETINAIANKIQEGQKQDKKMSLQDFEDRIIKVQRKVRGNIRRKNYKVIAKNLSVDEEQSEAKVTANIKTANKPYLPRCNNQALAKRIYRLAHEVNFISDMNHLTAAKYLDSILDNGISGRKNLEHTLAPFVPAALDHADIIRGDGNAVCCGPFKIDPISFKTDRTAKIVFDFDKVTATYNPHMFFKQLDLGFDASTENSITIGSMVVYFSPQLNGKEVSMLIAYNNDAFLCGNTPNVLLVSHNVAAMQPIFILNFFRYLDSVKKAEAELPSELKIIDKVYAELDKLSDDEIKKILYNLGIQVTQSAEINFEALFQFDIAMIKNIAIYSDRRTMVYNLNLAQLVAELNQGNTEKLLDAKKNIPELFNSYRFKQYLLSTVTNPAAIDVINKEFKAVEYKQSQFEKLKQRDISEAKTSTAKKHNNTEATTQPTQKPKT